MASSTIIRLLAHLLPFRTKALKISYPHVARTGCNSTGPASVYQAAALHCAQAKIRLREWPQYRSVRSKKQLILSFTLGKDICDTTCLDIHC